MSRAFTDWNVDQAILFPATARDYVPEDHPVHYVRQLVAEELDLSPIFESYKRMCEEERRLAEEVAGWLEEAEAIDAAEDERYGEDDGDELPPWMKSKTERLAKIREAKAVLEKEAKERAAAEREKQAKRPPDAPGPKPKPPSEKPEPKAQRNFTDPDSRIMRDKGTYVQAYNCQAAVDSDHQIIVAADVTQRQNDGHMLDPMLAQVKRNCGRQAREVSADASYCSEENISMVRKRHIRGYLATGRQKHGTGSATKAGKTAGPHRSAMATRLRRGGHRSRYRLRKHTVEPVFGQIKEAQGIRRFLLRGIEKVGREWQIICASHNLRKLMKAMA